MSERLVNSALSPAPGASSAVLRRQCACGNRTAGGGSCSECEKKKDKLRRRPDGHGEPEGVPAIVGDVLREPGRPLEAGARGFMESRFGQDFSAVRIHTDERAAASARAVNAQAYGVGNQLVFDSGRYAPQTGPGRALLAHELAHVVQSGRASPAATTGLQIGAANAPEEQQADAMAQAALANAPLPATAEAAPAFRRAPGTGPGWSGTKGINAAETLDGKVRRIPIDTLDVGHQRGASPSGRAIVLIPPAFDATKPIDILLHFHGHNAGYQEAGGKVRDQQQDRIGAQLQAATRPQTLAILPQGSAGSAFGLTAKGNKFFKTDDYVDAVLATLEKIGAVKPRPSVAGVMISGHSGAGELINEKLLGGDPDSALPSRFGRLKEVALFDAINGPNEFVALQGFLTARLASELKALQALPSDQDRLAFLKTSFRFRAYFSRGPATGDYYSKWHVGPVPKNNKIKNPASIEQLLKDFFKTNAAAVGGTSVLKAFEDNYKVIDAGTAVQHDEMVGANDHLKDALSVLPRLASAGAAPPEQAPPSVHAALRGPGRALEAGDRDWAEQRFHRDFGAVRIHDDAQARRSADELDAQAYTVGRDLVFGSGHYLPGTNAGRGLLAHELSHVLQQDALAGPARSLPATLPVGRPDDRWEQEAERMGQDGPPAAGAGLRLQRQPKTGVAAAVCEASANPPAKAPSDCSYNKPENCDSYEAWIRNFTTLKTFTAKDTPGTQVRDKPFNVIGSEAADVDFRTPSTPGPSKLQPKPTGTLKPGERFIDHPTDDWVKNCLPANLRATAYQLPADCADVVMILRHVWLSAHHRTEKFGNWTLGSATGKAEERAVSQMINSEGSGTVAGMVAPYRDANGAPLRSFQALEPLLHPGDILVWQHHKDATFKERTGGHAHTIADVKRDESNRITGLTLLQGNLPLFEEQKEDIHAFLKKEKKPLPSFDTLGVAPGRRIERMTHQESGIDLRNDFNVSYDGGKTSVPVWTIWGHTLLMAAGPPKAASRPPAGTLKGGKQAPPKLTDWLPAFRNAKPATFMGLLEAMLYELRALVEAGRGAPEADVRSIGSAAGAHLWAHARKAGDLGHTSHFQRLQPALKMIAAFGTGRMNAKADSAYGKITGNLAQALGWMRDAFEMAARGASDISFPAPGKDKKNAAVNVLLTGFDPFDRTGKLGAPGRGEWNPSGAAVMALDNTRLPVADSKGRKGTAAVEGLVLPVSFDQFRGGMVEQAIGPHARDIDALLTVSLDGGIENATDPVKLERYAAGVHKVGGKVEAVPAAPGGSAGPAITESAAPLADIAADTELAATKRSAGIARPSVATKVKFRFDSDKTADLALKALGLPPQGTTEISIDNPAALSKIMATMSRVGADGRISFQAGKTSFSATLLSGPGGDFLSNEVAYRAQRLLQATNSPRKPWSFHVHTPAGQAIPQNSDTKEDKAAQKKAIAEAMSLRGILISTLKRVIGSVAKRILDRRSPGP